MRIAVAALVLTLAALPAASEAGHRAEYVGGTLAAEKATGVFDLTDSGYLLFRTRDSEVRVPYERINLIEYGQKVDRRYAMAVVISPLLLLSKKRQHFLTLGYTDQAGRQQALVFRVGKADIRPVLVSLEARTGRKVQYQDADARRSGKG